MNASVAPEPAIFPESIPSRLRLTVIGDYLLSHLGFFTIAPVLAAVLARDGGGLVAGVALLGFTLSMRGASLFLAGIITRITFRAGAVSGLLASAVSFGLLTLHLPMGVQVLLLVAAGCGISMNGAVIRLYIASTLQEPANRHRVFTVIQVAVNVSAAVGPLIGNILFPMPRGILFGTVAVLYATAAATVARLIPARAQGGKSDAPSSPHWRALWAALAHRRIRGAVGLTIVGSFLYAQFFSGIALEIMTTVDSPRVRASAFVLNAVLVVAFQLPVTAWVARLLNRGIQPGRVMTAGILIFCAALVALGFLGGSVVGLLVVIVIFSLGETFYTPTTDTIFVEVREAGGLMELINLRLASAAIGESVGSLVGTSLVLLLGVHYRGIAWITLGVVAGVIAIIWAGHTLNTKEKKVAA